MSRAELESVSSSSRKIWPWVLAGVVLFLGALYLINRPRPRVTVQRAELVEDSLGQARQALARETDLNACRSAVQMLNNHLRRSPDQVASLQPVPRQDLGRLLGLDDAEFQEIQEPAFTLLDGRYLEQCFLLRDAAESLQPSTAPGTQRSALERATAAFRWTMRQVRLEEPNYKTFLAAPPTHVLRRGWGSALERGLVFLELLRQVGPGEQPRASTIASAVGQAAGMSSLWPLSWTAESMLRPPLLGCLVYCPGDGGAGPRLWACGVIGEGGSSIHLFDPRLGMPIPGPRPGEVATLGQVSRDPALLSQLTVSDKHRYDVTAEQAAGADLRLVCPLSALAPRMQVLQERLLGSSYHVQLVAGPLDDLACLKRASRAELGSEDRVRAWQEMAPDQDLGGPGLLRRFLGPEEGGSDNASAISRRRESQFYQSLLRWTEIPRPFNDPLQFPLNAELGMRVHLAFRKPLLDSINDPSKPRNLILRGRFSKATPTLVEEQRTIRELVNQHQRAGDLSRELSRWVDDIKRLYATQLRSSDNPALLSQVNQQIEAAWSHAPALTLIFAAAMAESRTAQLGYLLGLCKQDQAEVQQARLDLQTRAGQAVDATEARNTWLDALSAWDRFLDEHPQDPASGAVRHLRARALVGLGRWQEAAAAWENVAPPLTALEQVAGLYQAQQIRKGKEKK